MTLTLSPSQIVVYRDECKRKWAFRAISKIKVPDKPSAQLGTKMHKQLEGYLRGEFWDYSTLEARKISEIAIAGIHHLPKPNTPGMVLEGHFIFEADGIKYQGYRDVALADSADVPGLEGGASCVIDHKSTSDFQYAKTPEALRTDPQGVIYAYEAIRTFQRPFVDLLWIYYRTRGANQSKRVHLRVHQPDVEKEFQKIQLVGSEMVATHRDVTNVLDLPPNRKACGMFGGCPYAAQCTDLSPFQEGPPMPPSMADLFAKLKAQNGGAPSAVISQGGAPVPPPLPSSAVPPALTPPTAPVLPVLPGAAPVQASVPVPVPPAINPPGEAAPAPVVPPAIPSATAPAVPAVVEKPKRARRTNAQIAADNAAAVPVVGEIAAYAAEAPAAAAARVAVTPTIPSAPVLPVGITGDISVTIAETQQKTGDVEKKLVCLYLDCSPGSGTPNASQFFSLAKDLIKTELGEEDYRLIKYTGAAVFSKAVMHFVDNSNVDELVLDSRTPEALIVLEDLVARSQIVIRGMR